MTLLQLFKLVPQIENIEGSKCLKKSLYNYKQYQNKITIHIVTSYKKNIISDNKIPFVHLKNVFTRIIIYLIFISKINNGEN